MTIAITGADGYVGWPTALRVADRTDERVLLVDNFARREWVEEIGSVSATPVAHIEERLAAAREIHGLTNLSFLEGDLTERSFVDARKDQQVGEVMGPKFVNVSPTTGRDALAALLQEETPAVLVRGEHGFGGIVTTADLV